ncbi:helix-turn-helix domain-containing protein [Clostridium cochlearium]|uniref:helix-turn-helix domain-containing protein n=1 Tax=Clostridium cochlearium TaxID=1494 RepID=UPI000BBC16C6|nr:helix-turn-helix transcriptional regulator [Clostridium cochlearium]
MSIAKRVTNIRKSNNLTQKEFGEKLGVSRDVIFNIESGRVKAKDLFLTHLCDIFNVNKEWLLTGEGEMFIVPDDDALLGQAFASIVKSDSTTLTDIVAKLSTLDEEYLDLIEHLIDTLVKKK